MRPLAPRRQERASLINSRRSFTMPDPRLRQAIAFEAARLMYSRAESEYFTAKRKAARLVCRGGVKPNDLPSNSEIRDLIQTFARSIEGEKRQGNLLAMRLAARRALVLLADFKPHLIGSVMTGHIRQGSDIDVHAFSDCSDAICSLLEAERIPYEVEHKRITKHGETRLFTHVHYEDEFPVEVTVYSMDKLNYRFKSSITGKAIERASLRQFDAILDNEHPGWAELPTDDDENGVDPLLMFRLLLEPLEKVKGSPKYHPEGDCLYHSLQAFELARAARPWDEELITAALLHDVGKALDPADHVAAGLEALEGLVTERTLWLIEHHMDAHLLANNTLGHRRKRAIEESGMAEDLLLLQECDKGARVPGVPVCSLDEALEYLAGLGEEED